LVNLFNTARRFEMEVQPQLVLLQKTLLYVEGLGRTLYPQLDLWKTAKPFLERWMQEQLGWRAVLRSVKEHAPYWAEKMPEMPTLLYDYLRNQRHMVEQQQAATAALIHSQRKHSWRIWWGLASAATVVTTALFWVSGQPVWLTASSAVVAIASIMMSWRQPANQA